MPDDHPPLLGTNDRAKAHDPVFQAAQVAERHAAEAEQVEAAVEASEAADDDSEPDAIELDDEAPRGRGKHEKGSDG